jgi:hypothetical protein
MTNKPLEVEIITHVLGSVDHCAHCQVFIDGVGVGQKIHKTDLESYPSEWKSEWQQMSDLVLNLAERYAGKLVIKITDAQTPQALWKALRHSIRKYPTFLIAGEKYQGYDEQIIANLIDRHLQ